MKLRGTRSNLALLSPRGGDEGAGGGEEKGCRWEENELTGGGQGGADCRD